MVYKYSAENECIWSRCYNRKCINNWKHSVDGEKKKVANLVGRYKEYFMHEGLFNGMCASVESTNSLQRGKRNNIGTMSNEVLLFFLMYWIC